MCKIVVKAETVLPHKIINGVIGICKGALWGQRRRLSICLKSETLKLASLTMVKVK